MQARWNLTQAGEGAYRAMLGLELYLKKCGLEHSLLYLIKMRASQINGCAYCLDMHWKDARANGETEQRLYSLDAWEECPYYSERERAALAWTDAATRVSENHLPDELYGRVKAHFSEKEMMDLTLAVATINAWNRLAIGGRIEPGSYQVPRAQEVQSA